MEQASFTVSSWQEQPIDNLNENFPVNQASATYQLSGALSGTASVEYLMTYQGWLMGLKLWLKWSVSYISKELI